MRVSFGCDANLSVSFDQTRQNDAPRSVQVLLFVSNACRLHFSILGNRDAKVPRRLFGKRGQCRTGSNLLPAALSRRRNKPRCRIDMPPWTIFAHGDRVPANGRGNWLATPSPAIPAHEPDDHRLCLRHFCVSFGTHSVVGAPRAGHSPPRRPCTTASSDSLPGVLPPGWASLSTLTRRSLTPPSRS